MKILAISDSLRFGGAQISILEFLELLKNKVEFKVLVCKGADEKFTSCASSIGVEVYRVSCHTVMYYPVMNIKSVRKLIEWADVVWIADVEYLVAPRIKKLKKVPIAAHLRSYALVCHWWATLYSLKEVCLKKCSPWRITRCKQGINLELAKIGLLSSAKAGIYWLLDFAKSPLDYFRWIRLVRGVIDSIDGFIPVSKALWEIHTSHIPELKKKPFRIVYNLATKPLKYIEPDPNEPYENYILYASGSNPAKGPHILLPAWPRVSKEFRDLKLYMVGCRGTWVERLAKKLNARNVVFLERFPPDKQYYYMMYKAKAVVMPSLFPEPFGRIPVEANKLGVPVVVTDRGGLPEIIESNATGVISNADSKSLADAIARVVSREWSRSKIIESIYKRITSDNTVNKLLEFFEELLK